MLLFSYMEYSYDRLHELSRELAARQDELTIVSNAITSIIQERIEICAHLREHDPNYCHNGYLQTTWTEQAGYEVKKI